jgi:hypothetical protein
VQDLPAGALPHLRRGALRDLLAALRSRVRAGGRPGRRRSTAPRAPRRPAADAGRG